MGFFDYPVVVGYVISRPILIGPWPERASLMVVVKVWKDEFSLISLGLLLTLKIFR